MRVAAEIALSKEERRRLESWATTRSTSVRLRERARIVLMAAQGMTNKEIAAELEVDANKVGRWRARVAKEGTSSIEKERPRGANHGGKNTKKQAQLRSEVVEADDTDDTERRHPLVVPVDGSASEHHPQLREPGVAHPRPEAAPDSHLQAQQ